MTTIETAEQLRARLDDAMREIAELKKTARKKKIAALTSSDTDEWCTPAWLLDVVRTFSMTGRIALDPCWNARALTAPDLRFTARDDGLAQDWRAAVESATVTLGAFGVTFVNPPYSDMRGWAKKIRREAARAVEIVSLIKVDTSTQSWSTMVWKSAAAVAFFYKRLEHGRAEDRSREAKEATGSTFASALVYHGFRTRDFRAAFGPHAAVVVLR